MIEPNYAMMAKCTAVHDGDTATFILSPGFNIYLYNQKLRFWGINAYEMNSPECKGCAFDIVCNDAQSAALERLKELCE